MGSSRTFASTSTVARSSSWPARCFFAGGSSALDPGAASSAPGSRRLSCCCSAAAAGGTTAAASGARRCRIMARLAASLPSCLPSAEDVLLVFGEGALASRSPRTRRFAGEAVVAMVVVVFVAYSGAVAVGS